MRTTATALALALAACAAGRAGPSAAAIVRAAGAVRVGDPWPQARHTLHTQLGPPTKADVDAYLWAARVGDDCYLIEVRVADGRVAYVDDPYQSPARAAAGSYDRCADAAP